MNSANSLGNVGSTPVSTTFSIVHAQKNAIYFDGENGNTAVPSLWTSFWPTELAMVSILSFSNFVFESLDRC